MSGFVCLLTLGGFLKFWNVCLGQRSVEKYGFDSPATAKTGRANLMSLSKEITDSEKNVRSQLVMASMEIDGEKRPCESVWSGNGLFGEVKANFTLHKRDFPENALIYINQAYLSVKDGEPIIYCDYIVVGQLLILKNPPEEIDPDNKNYIKLYLPAYNREQGKFWGVKECLAYIMLRGDEDESFFMYGYDSKKSSILYCYSKQLMPNVFKGTSFNSHHLHNVAEAKEDFSKTFFYLPSVTDRKEKINQYKDQVSLIPVTCTLEDVGAYSPSGDYSFNPADLDVGTGNKKADLARRTVIEFFHNASKFSNSNLMQNVFALIKDKSLDQGKLDWAPSLPHSKADLGKFATGF